MTTKSLDQRIVQTPGICGGKPRIGGHRITVQDIAIWHDRLGRSADAIASEYDIELADIYAALAYYFAHRKEIDASLRERRAFIEQLRQETPSKLHQKLEGKEQIAAIRYDLDEHIAKAVERIAPLGH